MVLNTFNVLYLKNKHNHFEERPSTPKVTFNNFLIETKAVAPIAHCTATGFWSRNITVSWQLGDADKDASSLQNVTEIANNTFGVMAEYSRAVSQVDNGKTLTCIVEYAKGMTPLLGQAVVRVLCK